MKKRFGKVKKFIAMLLVGITLSSSVFYSYSIPAQASSLVPAAQTIIEALMTLFGYSLGYGRSSDGFSSVLNADTLSSAVDSALSGTGAVELGDYGSLDFSDEVAVFEFLKKAYQLTTATLASEAYDKILASCDYVSYATSGVSSTKTINEILGEVVTKYETEGTAALKEDMQSSFTVISDVASGDEDVFTPTSWRMAAGIMAGITALGSLPVVEVPETTEFDEYMEEDLVMDLTNSFTGFSLDASGRCSGTVSFYDSYNTSNYILYQLYGTKVGLYCDVYDSVSAVVYDGKFDVYINGSLNSSANVSSSQSMTVSANKGIYTSNLPLFSSYEALKSYFSSGDETGLMNKLDTSTVSVFYENTPSCTVPEYVVNFMTKSPSTQEVTNLAATLTGLPTDTAGTFEYIPSIEQAIQDATIALPGAEAIPETTAAPVVVPGEATGELTDEEIGSLVDSSSTYGGILGVLLNAILALPLKIFDHFVDAFNLILSGIRDGPAIMAELLTEPFSTVTKALDSLIDIFPADFAEITALITTLPVTLYEYFKDGITDVRDGIGTLVDVFPASIADVVDAVIDLPATLWQYLEGAITDIKEDVDAIAAEATAPWDDPDNKTEKSFDLVSLLNGLWLLIMILLMLLSIFLHLMIFIINIFKIPATTGYLNDDMIMGLNYIKTLEITGIGLSVYDFMMGLVYILMVFGVVKVLRHNINHIKVPKAIKGGLYR